ncbi:MAG TPA: hypothetical protein VD929_09610 [Caulobacteraceae bacterium]|nr:hypothetical protein [Caulobacteraceae bacterium]
MTVRVLTVVLIAVALSACGTGKTVRRGADRVGSGLSNAVTAPLEDLNLKRVDIPVSLQAAKADPYDLTGLTRCESIAAEVGRLDAALGPDLDDVRKDGRRWNEKGADAAADATLDAVRGTATDVVPFRSWVRRLTGAERHSKYVQAAIKAGTVRRGYLKGVGMRMNCAPPAAPAWFEPAPPETQRARPFSRPKRN